MKTLREPTIIIGKYELFNDGSGVWITIKNDGEGGKFNETELEKIIDKFYEENF